MLFWVLCIASYSRTVASHVRLIYVPGTVLTLSAVALPPCDSCCHIPRRGYLGGKACGEKYGCRAKTGGCPLSQRLPKLPPDGSGEQQPGKGSELRASTLPSGMKSALVLIALF